MGWPLNASIWSHIWKTKHRTPEINTTGCELQCWETCGYHCLCLLSCSLVTVSMWSTASWIASSQFPKLIWMHSEKIWDKMLSYFLVVTSWIFHSYRKGNFRSPCSYLFRGNRSGSGFYSLRFFTTSIAHNHLSKLRPMAFHTLWTYSSGYRRGKKIP